MRLLIVLALILAGCGGSLTGPSSTPHPAPAPTTTTPPAPPPPQTFTGTVTDTVSGAPVAGYSATLVGSRVIVSALGYLTRETRNGATVDLIRDAAPFSLAFYRQMVRNDMDAPGSLEPLRRLTNAPSIYLQTTGLTPAAVAALEHAARTAVYEFSGRTMGVVTVDSGEALRPDRVGWIIVEQAEDLYQINGPVTCGRALLGNPAGHVVLIRGQAGCVRPLAHTLVHEIGHAMGFWHVADPRSVMSHTRPLSHDGLPSAAERYHAVIAYRRPVGNTDLDVDPSSLAGLSAPRLVVD